MIYSKGSILCSLVFTISSAMLLGIQPVLCPCLYATDNISLETNQLVEIEDTLQNLQSPNAAVMHSAAGTWEHIVPQLDQKKLESLVAILTKKLQTNDVVDHPRIVWALGLVGSRLQGQSAERTAHTLLKTLMSPDAKTRQFSSEALGKMSFQLEKKPLKEMAEALIDRIDDESQTVRQSAANAFGQFASRLSGDVADRVAQTCLPKIQNKDQGVRQTAVTILGYVAPHLQSKMASRVLKILEELPPLLFEEYVVAQSVIPALGELANHVSDQEAVQTVDILLANLQDDGKALRVRESAGYALRGLVSRFTPEQLKQLIRFLLDHLKEAETFDWVFPQLLPIVAHHVKSEQANQIAGTLLLKFPQFDFRLRSAAIEAMGAMAVHLRPEHLEKAITRGERVLREDRTKWYSMTPVEQALNELKKRRDELSEGQDQTESGE